MCWFLINFAKIVMWLNTETSYWLEKDGNHCCDKWKPVIMYSFFFSSPDPKGHVSYCHHMSYVVNFFKNLLLWNYLTNGNQTWSESSLGCLVSKLCPVMLCTNQLLLKIKHMVKLQVMGNNSKNVNNIKNLKIISTARSTHPAILK